MGVMATTEAGDPAWTLGMVPDPLAAKYASASAAGMSTRANTTATTNERVRPAPMTRCTTGTLKRRDMRDLVLINGFGGYLARQPWPEILA